MWTILKSFLLVGCSHSLFGFPSSIFLTSSFKFLMVYSLGQNLRLWQTACGLEKCRQREFIIESIISLTAPLQTLWLCRCFFVQQFVPTISKIFQIGLRGTVCWISFTMSWQIAQTGLIASNEATAESSVRRNKKGVNLFMPINYNNCARAIRNKFMKDILDSSKLQIIERSWSAVNPNRDYNVSIQKVSQFLRLLSEEHQKLQTTEVLTIQRKEKLTEKIHNFILKYILQRQLNAAPKKQLGPVNQQTYTLDLKDSLQIWRWLREDQNNSEKINPSNYDQLMMNQFEIGQSSQPFEIKRNAHESNKSKKLFCQLLLEEQQTVIKKSLEMVHMYYHQFRIIFNHYCRCNRENQFPKTIIFDEVSQSFDKLNVNRFMLFCRDFDIMKTIQFKRKNEHNPEMNKQILLQIFKKGSYLQKHLDFDAFLVALVNIALKIHQNFDPRSYMPVELFLNSLKVKYHEEFVKRLDHIGIKYSPTQFLNCYKNIYKQVPSKTRSTAKSSMFTNPHFAELNTKGPQKQERKAKLRQAGSQNRKMRSESLPNIHSKLIQQQATVKKPAKQQQHQRKVSLPVLPAVLENRFFTPIEHNNHLNGFSKYLETKVGESSSVFKNRITGYSNINKIKSSPFHQLDNPEGITKQSFKQFIIDAKSKIDKVVAVKLTQTKDNTDKVVAVKESFKQDTIDRTARPTSRHDKTPPVPISNQKDIFKDDKNNKTANKKDSSQDEKTHNITTVKDTSKNEKPELIHNVPVTNKRQKPTNVSSDHSILQSLIAKIDLRDDDELLNNHLLNEKLKQHQMNQRIIQTLKKYQQ